MDSFDARLAPHNTWFAVNPDYDEADNLSEFERLRERQSAIAYLAEDVSLENIERVCDTLQSQGLNPDNWLEAGIFNMEYRLNESGLLLPEGVEWQSN